MRLKLVVLPAPFGPISATVSFSATEKLKSCTARKPPNRLLRCRTTSASAIDGNLSAARRVGANDACVGFRENAEQHGWPPQDHSDENKTVDRQLHPTERTA